MTEDKKPTKQEVAESLTRMGFGTIPGIPCTKYPHEGYYYVYFDSKTSLTSLQQKYPHGKRLKSNLNGFNYGYAIELSK